jgi:hypothetical protein
MRRTISYQFFQATQKVGNKVWSQDPALSVKCRATLGPGNTELKLFIKVVLHLETWQQLAIFFHFGNAIALSVSVPSLFTIQLDTHLGLPDFKRDAENDTEST